MLKNSNLAEKAFVAPVRSVLFVDDQFPTYEELVNGAAAQRRETARAGRLVASCRQRNYVCDVRNNPDALAQIETERIGVSDLVVLDYHLRGEGNWDDAVNFLARLARSPHFNLAVIYTGETNLIAARQTIAARVRGPSSAVIGAAGELPEVSPDENALGANVDDYIQGNPRIFGAMQVLFPRDIAAVMPLNKPTKEALLQRHFDAYLESKFGHNADNVPSVHVPIVMSGGGENGHWVQGGNVFIAIVPKPKPEDAANDNIAVILQKLIAAIVDWSPSLIEVMLAAAAGSILRHGLRKSAIDFADDALCSGLIYWFLAGDSAYGDAGQAQSEADGRARIEDLHRAIFDLLCSAALAGAADLSEEIIRDKLAGQNPIQVPAAQRVQLAKEWSKAKNTDETKMLLAANAFLCSTGFSGKHVTTGTVFRKDGAEEYWLCVSATCDMVPRKGSPNNQWRTELYPYRMMMVSRLQKLPAPASALINAHFGKNIFVKAGDEVIALEFVPKDLTEPSIAPMFVENAAMVVEGKFKGALVGKSAENALVVQSSEFRAFAQLKPDYASRLLQQSGHHLSRIGVDFLSRSNPPAAGGAAEAV